MALPDSGKENHLRAAALFCVGVVALFALFNAFVSPALRLNPGAFFTNESYIRGLYSPLDLKDSTAVFRYVFKNLHKEVTVYPSENYYYFRFTAAGKSVWGTLVLSADNRDQGVLGFGYIEKQDRYTGEYPDAVGGSKDLTAADGVLVKKITPFKYTVTFEGRTVTFILQSLQLQTPQHALLQEDERLVGPNFDESGIQFYLVYNMTEKNLFWILNEDVFVPETFRRINDELEVGMRTGFAFYLDTLNRRRILVGIDGYYALLNNWFDGPFDQLPDNYVKTGDIEVQKYMEASYGFEPGIIDTYGNFLHREGIRVAVAPYYAYYSISDLVNVIENCKTGIESRAAFISCITTQVFHLPENLPK